MNTSRQTGLSILNIDEMTSLTGNLTVTDCLARIKAIPALANLVATLEAGHNTALCASGKSQSAELRDVIAEEGDVDEDHDDCAHAIDQLLTAAAHWDHHNPKPGRGEALLHTRQKVLSQGITIVNSSYRGEAGHGQVVKKALTEDAIVKATLLTLSLDGGTTGVDVAEAWVAYAERLGVLETKRALLEVGLKNRVNLTQGRSAWLKPMNAFVAVLQTCTGPDAEALMAIVQAALDKARVRRAARRAAGKVPAVEPAAPVLPK